MSGVIFMSRNTNTHTVHAFLCTSSVNVLYHCDSELKLPADFIGNAEQDNSY